MKKTYISPETIISDLEMNAIMQTVSDPTNIEVIVDDNPTPADGADGKYRDDPWKEGSLW